MGILMICGFTSPRTSQRYAIRLYNAISRRLYECEPIPMGEYHDASAALQLNILKLGKAGTEGPLTAAERALLIDDMATLQPYTINISA